jgi:homogentisate 1,2-dioxygenase
MDLSVLNHHIPCQVTSTAAEYITLSASNTTMSTAGAKRTAAYRVREKLKHETPEELDAWNAKNREKDKMSKRRRRALQKQQQMLGDTSDHLILPVQDASLDASTIKELSMTSSAIRQRRYREKIKSRKSCKTC